MRYYFSVGAFLLIWSIAAEKLEGPDFCKDQAHFSTVTFTCCANQSYSDPSAEINPFAPGEDCVNSEKEAKLVSRMWKIYKCMLTKKGGAASVDGFMNFMLKRFTGGDSAKIKSEIEAAVKRNKERLPNIGEGDYNSKPIFDFLSVHQYQDKFKSLVPDAALLEAWDIYFAAEFEVCQKLTKPSVSDTVLKSYASNQCYAWMQSTARRGDCCRAAPVPFPILDEPPIDTDKIQEWTKVNLMSLAGTMKYNWTKLNESSNIARCKELATSMMLKQLKLEELKAETDKFEKDYPNENVTEPNPNAKFPYEKLFNALVPPYYPPELTNRAKGIVLPKSNLTYVQGEAEIQRISDMKKDAFKWLKTNEWESKPVTNRIRYVMWYCDAFKIISQRFKMVDISPNCY